MMPLAIAFPPAAPRRKHRLSVLQTLRKPHPMPELRRYLWMHCRRFAPIHFSDAIQPRRRLGKGRLRSPTSF